MSKVAGSGIVSKNIYSMLTAPLYMPHARFITSSCMLFIVDLFLDMTIANIKEHEAHEGVENMKS